MDNGQEKLSAHPEKHSDIELSDAAPPVKADGSSLSTPKRDNVEPSSNPWSVLRNAAQRMSVVNTLQLGPDPLSEITADGWQSADAVAAVVEQAPPPPVPPAKKRLSER